MAYAFSRLVARSLLWLLGPPLITGLGNIPRTGPVIVVANHTSLLDGFLLAAFWPRPLTFLSAAYLYKLPLVGTFLRAVGAIPVQKENGELSAIRVALRVLQQGGTLALFPEGRVSPPGKLGAFQAGWAYLAAKSGAPVLPVIITGTQNVLPKGATLPRRSKIGLSIATAQWVEKSERPRADTLASLNTALHRDMEQMLYNVSVSTH